MKTVVVEIHEAEKNFPKLVEHVEAGHEVIVTRFDKPVAKLVSYALATHPREPGLLAGQITINPGFKDLPPGFEAFPSM